MQINYYSNVKNPSVLSNITTDEWFNLIKDSTYKEQITKARNGEIDYKKTKLSLPCVTYNFHFNKYKTDENILNSTGLLYYDIDNKDSKFDIELLDKSKVYSYYHSFGGKGYSIIVKVDGVNQLNFKSTYKEIGIELGLINYIDTNAIKQTQFNVISFDSNIYVNPNSYTFSSSTNNSPQPYVIETKKRTYTLDGGEFNPKPFVIENKVRTNIKDEFKQIRFDNTDDIDIDENINYLTMWNGIQIVKCFYPKKKRTNNRTNLLISYTNNLVWLNPSITKTKALDVLKNVNYNACVHPVDDKKLDDIINSIFRYKEKGTLKPIYFWKTRKIIFRKGANLTRDEKLIIVNLELKKKWKTISHGKIKRIIKNWDFEKNGRITQAKIYEKNNISSKT
ncbi:MAG TPA: BT4734/BF3469 family protein, partial [Bacteroidia bacterium]|nr:BT4734/BF3469 family protein [Bacteroidia bacterium]